MWGVPAEVAAIDFLDDGDVLRVDAPPPLRALEGATLPRIGVSGWRRSRRSEREGGREGGRAGGGREKERVIECVCACVCVYVYVCVFVYVFVCVCVCRD